MTKAAKRIYERLRKHGYGAKDAKWVALTHEQGNAAGLSITWESDPDGGLSEGEYSSGGPYWWVAAVDEDGKIIDALGSVDFGAGEGPSSRHTDPCQWDAEAQVLSEALHRLGAS